MALKCEQNSISVDENRHEKVLALSACSGASIFYCSFCDAEMFTAATLYSSVGFSADL